MRKNIYKCDRCGKEINELDDYIDYDFDFCLRDDISITAIDLCNNCMKEFVNYLIEFFNMGETNE